MPKKTENLELSEEVIQTLVAGYIEITSDKSRINIEKVNRHPITSNTPTLAKTFNKDGETPALTWLFSCSHNIGSWPELAVNFKESDNTQVTIYAKAVGINAKGHYLYEISRYSETQFTVDKDTNQSQPDRVLNYIKGDQVFTEEQLRTLANNDSKIFLRNYIRTSQHRSDRYENHAGIPNNKWISDKSDIILIALKSQFPEQKLSDLFNNAKEHFSKIKSTSKDLVHLIEALNTKNLQAVNLIINHYGAGSFDKRKVADHLEKMSKANPQDSQVRNLLSAFLDGQPGLGQILTSPTYFEAVWVRIPLPSFFNNKAKGDISGKIKGALHQYDLKTQASSQVTTVTVPQFQN